MKRMTVVRAESVLPRAIGLERLAARGDLADAAELAECFASTTVDAATLLVGIRSAFLLGDGERALRLAQQLPKRLVWVEGAALWRLGCARRAEQLLTEAQGCTVDGERSEAAFHLAVLLWSELRYDEAEALVRTHYACARGLSRARLEQMLGWLELGRERFSLAGGHFERALRTYKEAGERDERFHGRLLQSVSITALETLDFNVLPTVDVEPPADLGREAREPWFYAMQNRAWLLMLAGRQNDALSAFLTALALADSPATASIAEVNLASFCRILGAPDAGREHLHLARRQLRAQQWSRANLDERMTLLEFALEAQKLEPTSAGETLTRYLSSSRSRRGDRPSDDDCRVVAIEAMARGALAAIHDRQSEALAAFRKALKIWSQLGYRYREAVTALLMHDVDGDEAHLSIAARALVGAPRSWLREEIERKKSVASCGVRNLTPAERRVMLAICEGKTSREIAQDFGRSFHTIRNQTVKVYDVMQVRTRAALVAECAKLGMISGSRSF
jgi:DNA-binding NarL/FixJ family response regulator